MLQDRNWLNKSALNESRGIWNLNYKMFGIIIIFVLFLKDVFMLTKAAIIWLKIQSKQHIQIFFNF